MAKVGGWVLGWNPGGPGSAHLLGIPYISRLPHCTFVGKSDHKMSSSVIHLIIVHKKKDFVPVHFTKSLLYRA